MKTAEAGRKGERGAIEILQSNYTDKRVRLDWSPGEKRKRKEKCRLGNNYGPGFNREIMSAEIQGASSKGALLSWIQRLQPSLQKVLPTQLWNQSCSRPPLSPFTALSLDAAAPPTICYKKKIPTRSGENPSTHTENILEGLENSIRLDNQLDYFFRGERREPF